MLDTIKGEIRVFTKEVEVTKGKGKSAKKETRTLYNACIGGTKQDDDSYLNVYVPVNFSRDLEKTIKDEKLNEQESFDILIKEAWFRAYKDRDENVKPVLFVNSAKIVK